ncbi:leucyl aminopeptidase [Clostridium sp. P21]|uniref:Probable cytosol aminopeptidase n=1 Tax=Clostridium muellerianum TaxID=2716538 RepID=A0A7Y0EJA5_9CLOT|nr:leucyl aminopeptidase [Clostridium muellerianum]NMM64526.1 leucyl aminopeptidase [Clostridium muellerianum]
MISVSDNKTYSNLLIFKFKNFEMNYPENIKSILQFSENTGEDKELECINTLGKCKYKNIFVLGLGTTEEFNSVKLFKTLGHAILKLKNSLTELDVLPTFTTDFNYTIAESLEISLYKYNGVKKVENKIKLKNINIISKSTDSINKGLTIGRNINFSRQLVNMPGNYITPKYLAQQSENIAKHENLDIEILDKYMLKQLGMNCICSVGKGSVLNPRLIVMQYFGNPKDKKILSLIGKGVTFDSGGISLKSSKGMADMISDMAGAASVLAVMKCISALKPKKNILALIPVVENMPSGCAYKPGDVITTYSGKTVEVTSTDAEGRLILCDAISYAKELGSTTIIDIATLTGSCSNFLGDINIGLLSNSNELASDIINCGKRVGENFWRLPNNIEYMNELKSEAADIKNSSGKCGAIIGGMFLQSFCEDINFAHIDIAGCAYSSKATAPYDKGSNALPARTLIEYIMKDDK